LLNLVGKKLQSSKQNESQRQTNALLQRVLRLMRTEKALNQSLDASSFVLLRIDWNTLTINNKETAWLRKGSTYAFSNLHAAAARLLN